MKSRSFRSRRQRISSRASGVNALPATSARSFGDEKSGNSAIEAVASACSGVAECACVGVPDPKTGEAVMLFVVRAPGAALAESDLLAHCRRELAAYKVPRYVRFLGSMPKSTVGKILRKDLRALA